MKTKIKPFWITQRWKHRFYKSYSSKTHMSVYILIHWTDGTPQRGSHSPFSQGGGVSILCPVLCLIGAGGGGGFGWWGRGPPPRLSPIMCFDGFLLRQQLLLLLDDRVFLLFQGHL